MSKKKKKQKKKNAKAAQNAQKNKKKQQKQAVSESSQQNVLKEEVTSSPQKPSSVSAEVTAEKKVNPVEEKPKKESKRSERKHEVDKEEKSPSRSLWWGRVKSWGFNLGIFVLFYLGIMFYQNRALIANGQVAPSFQLTSLSGKKYSLAQFKGKRVILHFWATWCPVCKANISVFRLIQGSYNDDPIFLSVVSDGHRLARIRQIKKEKKINYPILLGSPKIVKDYKVNRFPTTYFIDKKGRIASKDSGFLTPIGIWWRSLWIAVRAWFI